MTLNTSGALSPHKWEKLGVHHKNSSPATPGSEIYTCEPKSQYCIQSFSSKTAQQCYTSNQQ